jgi:uncharacterized protein YaeQ
VALTATIYQFGIELADIDRGVYETLDLRVARQPSETVEYMLTRVLAYCLEYEDGIALTEGVAAGDEPAVIVRDLTGRVTAWIEVGMPDASRVHRGHKLAGRAAVYTNATSARCLRSSTTAVCTAPAMCRSTRSTASSSTGWRSTSSAARRCPSPSPSGRSSQMSDRTP